MTTFTKHHGLGNDFLVTFELDLSDDHAELARRLCDRRLGIGADGLLLGAETPGEATDLTMVLYNADGSLAEISGNGIRCFAQAAHRRTGRRSFHIRTGAGPRSVAIEGDAEPDTIQVTVEMGTVEPLAAPAGWELLGCDPLRPAAHLSIGNPHSVVAVDDVSVVDLSALGALVPQVNLEIVEPGPGPSEVTMRVHERGAGITQACGSGACVTAVAAHRWGLTDPDEREIVVHMPGGSARVRLEAVGDGPQCVTLIGPTTFVATVVC